MNDTAIAQITNLVHKHRASLIRFTQTETRDPDTAEDLVQDAFLKLLKYSKAGGKPTRGMLLKFLDQAINDWRDRRDTADDHLAIVSPEDLIALSDAKVHEEWMGGRKIGPGPNRDEEDD